MATGATLEQLLNQLASETGNIQSASYGIGARDARINILNRVQEFLYNKHDWPHLIVKKDLNIQAGSRYYDFPALDPKRIINVVTKYGGEWQPVTFGIDEESDIYFTYDPDLDRRSDPVLLWDFYRNGAANQFQVFPIPLTDYAADTKEGVVRIKGIATLVTMVNNADIAILDDRLIVLFAAAEILAKLKSPDAGTKLNLANQLYGILTANASSDKSFTVGGSANEDVTPRIKIRAVYNGSAGA